MEEGEGSNPLIFFFFGRKKMKYQSSLLTKHTSTVPLLPSFHLSSIPPLPTLLSILGGE